MGTHALPKTTIPVKREIIGYIGDEPITMISVLGEPELTEERKQAMLKTVEAWLKQKEAIRLS